MELMRLPSMPTPNKGGRKEPKEQQCKPRTYNIGTVRDKPRQTVGLTLPTKTW